MKTRARTRCHGGRFKSPLGDYFAVVQTDGALVTLEFARSPKRQLTRASLQAALERHGIDVDWHAARAARAARQVADYFDGGRERFDLRVAPRGTAFQQRVWRELQRIPYGQAISYGALATKIGHPGAARAVGSANGSNPISIVIPCHRVIGSSGHLTGYGGGLERKRALLALEGYDAP
jgi:methylated-DNA-[protein]-cysteine S-methyltransferase